MATFPQDLNKYVSQSSTNETDQHIIVSRYGDGYEQRAAMGVNSMATRWTISTNYMNKDTRDTFKAWYNSVGRVKSFTWTPPQEDTPMKFVFDTGLNEGSNANYFTFSFTLRQVFE